jgi:hypothetical protein
MFRSDNQIIGVINCILFLEAKDHWSHHVVGSNMQHLTRDLLSAPAHVVCDCASSQNRELSRAHGLQKPAYNNNMNILHD